MAILYERANKRCLTYVGEADIQVAHRKTSGRFHKHDYQHTTE